MTPTIFDAAMLLGLFGWAYFVFLSGQSSRVPPTLFYGAAFLPFVAAATYAAAIAGIIAPIHVSFGILLVVGLERVAWAFTLRETSGRDRLAWFMIVYFVPFFGWLLYRLTEAR